MANSNPYPASNGSSSAGHLDTAVTTLALLIRKKGISGDLFSRYWRDVHGVLAARIPGFETYTQFHLGAPWDDLIPASSRSASPAHFDGLAEVSFNDADMRQGLATSDVTAMIQEDEKNVFSTSLLYNLGAGASRTVIEPTGTLPPETLFILLGGLQAAQRDDTMNAIHQVLAPALNAVPSLHGMRIHILHADDAKSWHTAGVENSQTPETAFDAIVQLDFVAGSAKQSLRTMMAAMPSAAFQAFPRLQVYPVHGRYRMVEGGRPTPLGLRGLDALRTIEEAGAQNQLAGPVVRCIYGDSALGR